MKKFSLILASYAEYKLLFVVSFFSNYWLLLSNMLAVSQVPEDCHCLKRNTYTSLDLNSVILNEIWHCHVLGKPKQPKKRLIWFKPRYPSPLKIQKQMGFWNIRRVAKAASGKSTHCQVRWFIQKLQFSSSWVVGNTSGGDECVVRELLAYKVHVWLGDFNQSTCIVFELRS